HPRDGAAAAPPGVGPRRPRSARSHSHAPLTPPDAHRPRPADPARRRPANARLTRPGAHRPRPADPTGRPPACARRFGGWQTTRTALSPVTPPRPWTACWNASRSGPPAWAITVMTAG